MNRHFLIFILTILSSVTAQAMITDLSQIQGTYADENGFVINVHYTGPTRGVSFETLQPMVEDNFLIDVKLSTFRVEDDESLRLHLGDLFVSGTNTLSFIQNIDNTASLVCLSRVCLSHRLLVEFRIGSDGRPSAHLSFQQWNNHTNLIIEAELPRVD